MKVEDQRKREIINYVNPGVSIEYKGMQYMKIDTKMLVGHDFNVVSLENGKFYLINPSEEVILTNATLVLGG